MNVDTVIRVLLKWFLVLSLLNIHGSTANPSAQVRGKVDKQLKLTEEMYLAAKAIQGAVNTGAVNKQQFADLVQKLSAAVEVAKDSAAPAIVERYEKANANCRRGTELGFANGSGVGCPDLQHHADNCE